MAAIIIATVILAAIALGFISIGISLCREMKEDLDAWESFYDKETKQINTNDTN